MNDKEWNRFLVFLENGEELEKQGASLLASYGQTILGGMTMEEVIHVGGDKFFYSEERGELMPGRRKNDKDKEFWRHMLPEGDSTGARLEMEEE